MDETLVTRIAELAADRAVEKTMLRLGIDPSEPEQFVEAKLDLNYLRRLRKGADIFKSQGIGTLAKLLATFIVAALVAYAIKVFHWPSN